MKNFTLFSFLFFMLFLSAATVAQTNFWEMINSPINGYNSFGIDISQSGTIFIGTSDGVALSSDEGLNWIESTIDRDVQIYIFAFNSTGEIFCAGIGGFFRASDGIEWTKIMNNYIASLLINDNGNIFAGSLNGILRSTDDGVSWINKEPGLLTYSLAINSQGSIFAGGWASNAGTAVVFRSSDNGISWTNTNFSASLPVNNIAFAPSGHMFVTLSTWDGIPYNGDGIYRSTDNGASWGSCNFGLSTTSSITGLEINSSGHVFIGTYGGGVFRSTDDGLNWTNVNTGLTNDTVISMAMTPEGTLFAATFGGLFRSVQPTTSVKDPVDAPISFSLNQNYPNPFNPTTKINFQIPNAGIVSLKVYDVLGKEVATLINEEKPAGSYEIEFSAQGLSSGIYFYKMQTGSFVETKKMSLLK